MELTASLIVNGIIFLLTIIIGAFFYMTRNFHYWKKRGVAEISPVPFFGNFAKCCTLKLSPGYLFKNLYEQSENLPYVGIYIFNKPCLLLRDPEIIKRVLIKDFNIFSDKFAHSSEKENLSNKNLFLIGNPEWKYLKTKLSSLFTSRKLKNMFEYLQDVRKDFDDYMDSLELEGSGKSVNVKELCAKFTVEIVGLTVLGLKLNCLRDPKAEFQQIVKRKMTGVSDLRRAIEVISTFLVPQITTLFDFRLFDKSGVEFFRKPFLESLYEREKSKIKRNDLIDSLIQLRNSNGNNIEEENFKYEEDDLLSQAIIFFLAGYDSSALTMTLTLYELARHPDVQMKLRDDINNAIQHNNGEITYNMVTELQYLDMIISESLRMYPVLPIIDRITKSDYKIDKTGLIIEKGTPILIPMLGLHYDPKYFTNPDVYNPENFSDENKTSRNPYVFMPFGIGPRSCIGMRQGLLQSKLGIAQIISRFEVTLSKDSSIDIDPKGYFTLFKEDHFLNIRKITQNTN